MTDEQNKAANKMYASHGGPVKPSAHKSTDRSKYDSQTTWGPSRRKKKRSQGKGE